MFGELFVTNKKFANGQQDNTLDRLFLLLDSGSSPLTRRAAALQVGEVQKLHPHELHNLLAKVRNYLHSSTWDTRIAAGQAVEAIINNVPQWNPSGVTVMQVDDTKGHISSSCAGRMKFSLFDINKVIQNGSDLLASEGTEYETDENTEMDSRERLAKQRQLLNKRLGLIDQLGLDTSYISCDDFQVHNSTDNHSRSRVKKDISEVYSSEISQMSLNSTKVLKAKQRHSRTLSKQMAKDMDNITLDSSECEPATKKMRIATFAERSISENSISMDSTYNSEHLWEESKEWPLEAFSDELVQDLFNPSWEIRHGAATALRDVIRIHGRGAGRTSDTSADQMDLSNQLWLEDTTLRLTCVLALDKFGDFISDQVVAPVRETCAQALGAVVNIMSQEGVEGILKILLQLLARPEWEARHGGLLGLKYILAVRKDMKEYMIPIVFDPVCGGLKDAVDDVSAVAASALVPVTDLIVSALPHKVSNVISSLWDALLDLDDLTASTSSILQLLASLLSYADTLVLSNNQQLDDLVPRLWPFLSHNSSVVRKSVLQTLIILTSPKKSQSCESWLPNILPTALRLVYQRCLVEHLPEIHDLLYTVWKNMITQSPLVSVVSSTFPFLSSWLSMLMQPSKVPIDPNTNSAWLDIQHKPKDKIPFRCRNSGTSYISSRLLQEQLFIGGNESLCDNPKEREKNVVQAKTTAAKFIGLLSSFITKPLPDVIYPDAETPIHSFSKLIMFHLNFKSALQRLAASLVLSEWANHDLDSLCPPSLKEQCLQCLNENIYFDEIAISFTRMQQECKDFIAQLKHYNVPLEPSFTSGSVFTFEQITHLATSVYSSAVSSVKLKPKVLESLEERRKSLLRSVTQTSHDQYAFTTMVQAAIAGALVSLKYLPEKLNPVIRPLMDSIKKEENILLQKASACHMVNLIELCLTRTNCPNPKIIQNLIKFLCNIGDDKSLPSITNSTKDNETNDSKSKFVKSQEIITLVNMQKIAEAAGLRRSNSAIGKKISSAQSDEAMSEDESQKASDLQKQGATFVFRKLAEHFGVELSEKLPKLWESMFQSLMTCVNPKEKGDKIFSTDADLQQLLHSLQVLEVISPSLHPKLHSELDNILAHVCCCLEHPSPMLRHRAAKCLGVFSKVITVKTMNTILDDVLSNLGATDNDIQRQGAVEAIACIIDEMGLDVVPFIIFLIVPMLGRMSDQNEQVRSLATHCFASLIKLMPLESGIKSSVPLHPDLVNRKEQERFFLEQLMNPKKIEPYVLPVSVNAELRSYQQEGINWLYFLNKYKLHGILCDDMGLGKTLQSICILAGDHYFREQQYHKNKQVDCKPLPSLVVCPPTLTGHWIYEVEKFVQFRYLNPIHYTGPPVERTRLRSKVKKHNLVIASYDIVRNDIDFFGSIHWNYCILDEGHIIKNGKTKLAKAIKQLLANHRLILSGTPIQNNVLELWSLFDFLIPGFLGTERQFTARYSKPILQSRDAKSSSKEQEAGALAMESLHRQVLPFLLRRMKEDVLKDLPPKIIQDYYCELSPLQVRLYEDFAKSRARHSVEETLVESECPNSHGTTHIFQALQYLRKVCNHPKLVLSPSHPEYESILLQLKQKNSNLNDFQHAAKLSALRQLLQDCGIGASTSNSAQNEPEPVVNQHRALVFCQLKSMLNILENDLFKSLMPSVSYLRLDGNVPPAMRHAVVHRFNNDPSIDLLLLTTQVGGLGLNLTGADTVIFVEHDWNPMRDLQAMDRAHRIGQKKVVNVYRLITRGTLEEKIMGLQKFKLSIANSVINQENACLQNMGTDQLLDLFTLDNKGDRIAPASIGESSQAKGKEIKSVLESLPELWDTEQYESEYDLTNFLRSLKE